MNARAAQGDKKAKEARYVAEKAVEKVVVERYWPGKAPKWSGDQPSAGADEDDSVMFGGSEPAAAASSDRRLQRLADAGPQGSDGGDGARRRRHEAEVLEGGRGEATVLERGGGGGRPVEESESEDEDAAEARRERLRAVQRRRRQQEEEEAAAAEAAVEDEEEEEEGEESSSYETDTDDADDDDDASARKPMLKPVFITAAERETIKERELIEEQERAAVERKAVVAEKRKEESKALLIEAVRKEETGELDKAVEFTEMPDDDDDVDELEEFDLWKVRELKRVRREREERAQAERDKAELERRRNLTDAERAAEDEAFRAGKADADQDKAKWKFLQKYYHRGAYFQDEDEKGDTKLGPVMMRDYGEATGKDAVGDKSAMPAPMQVKNFGFRSQVKWTHLSNEDTSGFSRPSHGDAEGKGGGKGGSSSKAPLEPLWSQDKQLATKFQNKTAGHKGANDFDRPSAKRRKGP